MTSRIFLVSMIFCGALLFTGTASAGGNGGDFGFGLSVVESSPNFMFQLWLSKKVTIEPTFAVINISSGPGGDATRTFAGLGLLYHFRSGADLRPQMGIRFEIDNVTGDGWTDVLFAPIYGAQYFFSDNFAISGEYQVVIIATGENGSPSLLLKNSTYVTTSQLLSVHFYF